MASILKVDTLTGVTTAGSISVTGEGNSTTTNLQQGLAKAWAHFDGSAATINDDLNFSSLTDNSTGDYNPNLTNNMSSVSYSCAGSSNMTSSNRGAFRALTYTTSTVNIVIYGNGSVVDASDVSVNFHGDLA
tara:strand:+ start:1489 stop:1884 length:396 start_codon:yes stop_codon:yes gene_type:complete